jgi:hypothetical protein
MRHSCCVVIPKASETFSFVPQPAAMRKCQKMKRRQQTTESIPIHTTERRKSVSFDPCKNNTRIFHRKDTPASIARVFKKPEEEKPPILKPILRYSSSQEDIGANL